MDTVFWDIPKMYLLTYNMRNKIDSIEVVFNY